VQGWTAVGGVVDVNGSASDVVLPLGTVLQPVATSGVTLSGNLPAGAATPIVTSISAFDAQGNVHTFSATFTNTAGGWITTLADGVNAPADQAISFAANGSTPNPTSMIYNGVTVDLTGITNYAGASTAAAVNQNGSAMGSLQAFNISPDGTVQGVFSNGLKQPLARIAMASFTNPPGLEKAGDSDYRATANSGVPQLGPAGNGGRGTMQSGALEMSNVDLAQEFTNLVIAQRGFQANSKVITTSDELLGDLVNLKR
jgi:flagellar hook protein FlgE